jgi:hypothetical protein
MLVGLSAPVEVPCPGRMLVARKLRFVCCKASARYLCFDMIVSCGRDLRASISSRQARHPCRKTPHLHLASKACSGATAPPHVRDPGQICGLRASPPETESQQSTQRRQHQHRQGWVVGMDMSRKWSFRKPWRCRQVWPADRQEFRR